MHENTHTANIIINNTFLNKRLLKKFHTASWKPCVGLYIRIQFLGVLSTEPVDTELVAGHTGSGTQSQQDVLLNIDILLLCKEILETSVSCRIRVESTTVPAG